MSEKEEDPEIARHRGILVKEFLAELGLTPLRAEDVKFAVWRDFVRISWPYRPLLRGNYRFETPFDGIEAIGNESVQVRTKDTTPGAVIETLGKKVGPIWHIALVRAWARHTADELKKELAKIHDCRKALEQR